MTGLVPAGGAQAEVNPQQQWLDYAKQLVATFLTTGRYTGPQVQMHLRPMFAVDETRILHVPFRHFTFTGIGDGSVPDATLMAAGAAASGNLAIMVGSLAGGLIASSAAKKAAIPKWHELPSGELVLTEYGIYVLKRGEAPLAIVWDQLIGATLTAWDSLEVELPDGRDALITPAATAIFGLWCLAVYPQHPQLQTLLQS